MQIPLQVDSQPVTNETSCHAFKSVLKLPAFYKYTYKIILYLILSITFHFA